MSKTYFTDRVQGVGAIAAAAPAPRSAPAPSFGKLARRADPMLNLPTTSRVGPAKVVLRGGSPVVVRTASLARPYALMSGVRRGPRPLMGMGGLGATNLGEAGISGQGGGGRGPIRSRGATVAARAQIAGMKSGAYVPPSAPQGGGTPGMTTRQPVQQVMTGLSTAPLRVQPPKVQTFPGPPPAAPRIGYGIGQEPGPVLATPPSPYGPGVSSPTSPPGSGLDVNPVLEQYDPNTGMTELEPVLVTSASASSGGHGPLLLLGGGLVVLYLLTRKRRRS